MSCVECNRNDGHNATIDCGEHSGASVEDLAARK